MASGRRPRPVRQSPLLYHHTPMVTDQFEAADTVSSVTPVPGIDFHSSPELFSRIRQQGVAPDWMFRQGLAAPATPENESGLRHYAAEFTGDPNRVLNLDVPLGSQTPEVRESLKKLGIRHDDAWSGGQLTVPELLWQRGLGKYADDYLEAERAARAVAGSTPAPEGLDIEALRNEAAPSILQALTETGIPAASRQGTGYQAGGFYLPRQPSRPVREVKVFDPNAVRVVRALSAPGAVLAGLASEARADEPNTVMAGEGEGLQDYLQRMQPPRQRDQTLGETVKEAVSQYLPYYGQEMLGTAKPLTAYSRDFPEMEDFRSRVSKTLKESKVIRGELPLRFPGEPDAVTPAEYAATLMGLDPDEAGVEFATTALLPHFLGEAKPDAPFAKEAQEVLVKLRAQGMGGEEQVFPGQTLAQREARITGPLQDGRYTTSEGLDKNLAATRAFNLLSTLQQSPQFRPNYANAASGVLPLIGAAMSLPFGQGEEGTVGGDTWEQFWNRNVVSNENPVRARVLEALANERLADEGEFAGQYRSSVTGGYYPQTSWTTAEGMDRQSNDNANQNAFWNEYVLPQFFVGTPVYTPATRHPGLQGTPEFDRGKALRSVIADSLREVPIVPEGVTPAEAETVGRQAKEYLDQQSRQFMHNYPMYQRAWNSVLDGLTGPGGEALNDALRVQEYSYPSPALNYAANAPAYWLDAPTIATLGVSLPLAAAQGSVGSVVRAAGKDMLRDAAMFEAPLVTGIHMADEPYSSNPGALFQAIPAIQGDVLDADGRPADPNAENYPELLRQHREKQKKILGGLLDYGVRTYSDR